MTPIQLFVIINLFVVGLSHFLRPSIWVDFFQFLHQKGNIGNIFNGLIALGMGSLIISFHIKFKWPMIIVTLYGVALVFKGLIYLTFPSIGLSNIKMKSDSSHKFRIVGLIMFLISLYLGFELINN